MTLFWRDPFEAMNRLFDESMIWPRWEFLPPRTFPVNIYETED